MCVIFENSNRIEGYKQGQEICIKNIYKVFEFIFFLEGDQVKELGLYGEWEVGKFIYLREFKKNQVFKYFEIYFRWWFIIYFSGVECVYICVSVCVYLCIF